MAFKDRLREARKLKGLTQKEVAEKIGVATSTYTGYETGKSEPYMCYIFKLLSVLDVDANFLFQDESENYEVTLSPQERLLISKYRELADSSKAAIDGLLDNLYERDNPSEVSLLGPPPSNGIRNVVKGKKL